jgi:tetratricopeptide (TPR) repeat protein
MWCIPGSPVPAAAEDVQVVLKGKVVMRDGSPLPSQAGIQRHCSDGQGSAPGPLTSKKGDYTWRLEVDDRLTRTCYLEAAIEGYESTRVDVSNLSGHVKDVQELATIVLTRTGGDPRVIRNSDQDVPRQANSEWKAAMKAGDAGNYPEFATQLKAVVAAAPKFARGWHTLGIAYELLQMPADARDAYTHAIEADPKMLVSYVTLSRTDVLVKDWAGAESAAQSAIKLDTKRSFAEVYLHQAVARYELKNFAGAEESIKEAVGRGGKQTKRAELVYGRILDAKGDAAGAREHVAKFLAENPTTPDAELIKAYLSVIGKPEATALNPDLELP